MNRTPRTILPRRAPELPRGKGIRRKVRVPRTLNRRSGMSVLTVLGCLLTFLGGAAAAQTFAPSPPNGIVLVSPAPGSRLVAGQRVTLAWRPGADFERLAWVEEWEAFLSLDGGRHFSIRITPHLDLALRTITWRVPNLASADVRLLLRFGDETREVLDPLPAQFEIVPARGGRLLAGGPWQVAGVSFASGEPALPGSAGVVAWSEGGREDQSARWVTAVCWQTRVSRVKSSVVYGTPPAAIRDPMPSPGGPRAAESGAAGAAPVANVKRGADPCVRDLLLLTDRRNE